ncbi:MAG: BMP family ABC transporter substrate-binding protein [Actinomycetaceae bacterium]|nr:BMP family ABC transporter substrate-binding protein [Actinomycetaceae bacterium]MDY6082916.1 BMP family ABC transporter substrate-binding protein [Actinomycetaceae bacterium]
MGAAAMLLSACGGSSSSDSAAGASGEKASDFKACLVSDAGGWDDHSFNESAKIGLDKAVKEYGIQSNTAESKSDADFGPNTQSMVDDGCKLIIGVGFNLNAATVSAAKANTDLQFALVDSVFTDTSNKQITLDNARPLVFATQEAAYLAGYAAAGFTKTGKVATFGGMQIPSVWIFMDGFADGVDAYNKAKGTNVQLLGWDKATQKGAFVNTFDDQQKGKTQAQQFIDQGADIIMPVAGPVGAGAAQAAQAAHDVYIVGVDSDWYTAYPDYKSVVFTSVMKEIGASVQDTIKADIDGKFSNEQYVGTLQNGGVSLAPFHDFDSKVPQELKDELQKLTDQIKSGDLKVTSTGDPRSTK